VNGNNRLPEVGEADWIRRNGDRTDKFVTYLDYVRRRIAQGLLASTERPADDPGRTLRPTVTLSPPLKVLAVTLPQRRLPERNQSASGTVRNSTTRYTFFTIILKLIRQN
jgi:hypothetical protein